eukprot:83069-Chlamydomonas_euryale.AAC.1
MVGGKYRSTPTHHLSFLPLTLCCCRARVAGRVCWLAMWTVTTATRRSPLERAPTRSCNRCGKLKAFSAPTHTTCAPVAPPTTTTPSPTTDMLTHAHAPPLCVTRTPSLTT